MDAGAVERAKEMAHKCRYWAFGGPGCCYPEKEMKEIRKELKRAGADVEVELLFGMFTYYRIWVRWP